jgi:hypothetical protein
MTWLEVRWKSDDVARKVTAFAWWESEYGTQSGSGFVGLKRSGIGEKRERSGSGAVGLKWSGIREKREQSGTG